MGVNYHKTTSVAFVLKLCLAILFSIFTWLMYLNIANSGLGSWSAGELLINYSGGFVRRGFVGSIISVSGAPLEFATVAQRVLVISFLTLLFINVLAINNLRLVLSISIIAFLTAGGLYDMYSGGKFEYMDRKEVWFYASILLMALVHLLLRFSSLHIVILASVISIVMILHHELFAVFFVPPLFLLLILKCSVHGNWLVFKPLIYLISTSVTFLCVYFNAGDAETASSILLSYQNTDASLISGGISAIGWSLYQSHELSLRMVTQGSLNPWLYHLTYTLGLCFVLTYAFTKSMRQYMLYIVMLIWLLFASGIASYIGWDWGRFISMVGLGYVCLILLATSWLTESSESDAERKTMSALEKMSKRKLWIIATTTVLVLAFSIMSLSSRMPHCCIVNDVQFGLFI